jgi:hypothetical protein
VNRGKIRRAILALLLVETVWAQEIGRVTLVVDSAHYSPTAISSWSGTGALGKAIAAVPSGASATIQVPAGYTETLASPLTITTSAASLAIQGSPGNLFVAGADDMSMFSVLANNVTVQGIGFDANGYANDYGISAGTSVSQDNTGTVSVAAGGTAVTGVGTSWTSAMAVRSVLLVNQALAGGGSCTVASVNSPTSLTCAQPFTGSSSQTNQAYALIWETAPGVTGFVSDHNTFNGFYWDHYLLNVSAEVENSLGFPTHECVLYNTLVQTFTDGGTISYHDSICHPQNGMPFVAMEAQGNGISHFDMHDVTIISDGLAEVPGIFSGGSDGYGGPYDQLISGSISHNHCENTVSPTANSGTGAFALEVYGHDWTVSENDCNGTAVGLLYGGNHNKFLNNHFKDISVNPAAQTTGSISTGSSTLTVASATGIVIGQVVVDTGTAGAIPLDTRITGGSGTTWTLSAAATANLSGENIALFSDALFAYGWGMQSNSQAPYTGPKWYTGDNLFLGNTCQDCQSGLLHGGEFGGDVVISNRDERQFGKYVTDPGQIYRGIEVGGSTVPDLLIGNQSILTPTASGYSLSTPGLFFWGCVSDQTSSSLAPVEAYEELCQNQNATQFGQLLVGFGGYTYFNGATIANATSVNLQYLSGGVAGLQYASMSFCGNQSQAGNGSAILGDFLTGCNFVGSGGPTVQVVTFTPTAIGWYRVAGGSNLISGHLEIFNPQYDGTASDLGFWYAGSPSANSYINQDQFLFYNYGSVVDQARLSYDGSSGTNIVYLDIHVATATSPTPLTMYFSEWGVNNTATQTVVTSPVAGATAVNLTATLTAGPGFVSTVPIANAQLANSSVTVTPGTGISGGGTASLGGSVTITNAGVTSITGSGLSCTSGQHLQSVSASASTGGITLTGVCN